MIRFFSYTRRLVVAAYSSHLLNVPLFFFHLYIIWEDLGIPIFSIVFAQILSPPFPCLCHRASLDEPLMSGICVPTNALQCWNILRCHSMSLFFFVVSFLFRSPALVQQVQICWCPQWLEEANFSACKIHLCRERLFHHRILDNQNIARLVNSRVTLQRITRLCIAPIEPPIHLNLSAIITLDASKHLRPWVRAGLNQRRHKEWGKPLTVITNPPETGPPMKEG